MLSYARGDTEVPLSSDTVGDYFDRMVEEHGEREALVAVHQNLRRSYRELHADVECAARAMVALGVQRGDRVALWAGSRLEPVVLLLAAAKVGAVVAMISPLYRSAELRHSLQQVGVSLLVFESRVRDNDCRSVLREVLPDLERHDGVESDDGCPRTIVHLGSPGPSGALSWDAFLAQGSEGDAAVGRHRQTAVECTAPALILFTSGSTGTSKAAALSHRTLLNVGRLVAHRLRYSDRDRVCVPVPLYHSFGCLTGAIAAMTCGASTIIPGSIFEPRGCLQAIERERCTAVLGVPTMFASMLEQQELGRYDLTSLRTGVVAGASCRPDQIRRIIAALHLPELTVGYGLTEMSPILRTRIEDGVDRWCTATGKVEPHVECSVLDPETKALLPRGVPGELCARGYSAMRGYWQDPAASARTIDAEGWVHTGDLAVMNEDGYVVIVGRLKDVIIRGGKNVHPLELEDFLRGHPSVSDAQVVAVPDEEYGEEVCAWIQPRSGAAITADDLRDYCRHGLSSDKIPRYVLFAATFPTTSNGKIQKFKLRELALRQLSPDREHVY